MFELGLRQKNIKYNDYCSSI